MNIKYKPSKESKINEEAIKAPLIIEHNIIGLKFKDGEITKKEWVAFQKEWRKRFQNSMHSAVKNRVYVEDIS
jgi:hypothetical protein